MTYLKNKIKESHYVFFAKVIIGFGFTDVYVLARVFEENGFHRCVTRGKM